jgi:heme A synthase
VFVFVLCIRRTIACISAKSNVTLQGHAYNTFPKMGDDWIPEGLMDMKPFFRNFFENTATVQVSRPFFMIYLIVWFIS